MGGEYAIVAANQAFEGISTLDFIVEFPYNVSEFYLDDSRLTVSTDGENETSGKRFTIQGLSGTYLEEIWFGWNYNEASWFTAADTSVSIFDDEDANVTINV